MRPSAAQRPSASTIATVGWPRSGAAAVPDAGGATKAAAVGTGTAPVRLDPDALYLAPTGRMCRLQGMDGRGPAGEESVAQLVYVRDAAWALGGSRFDDGVCLKRENWRILKAVAYAQAR